MKKLAFFDGPAERSWNYCFCSTSVVSKPNFPLPLLLLSTLTPFLNLFKRFNWKSAPRLPILSPTKISCVYSIQRSLENKNLSQLPHRTADNQKEEEETCELSLQKQVEIPDFLEK